MSEPIYSELEETVARKFRHLSLQALILRMQHASTDQNLDDESLELTRRVRKQGKSWHWEQPDVTNNYQERIVIVEAAA